MFSKRSLGRILEELNQSKDWEYLCYKSPYYLGSMILADLAIDFSQKKLDLVRSIMRVIYYENNELALTEKPNEQLYHAVCECLSAKDITESIPLSYLYSLINEQYLFKGDDKLLRWKSFVIVNRIRKVFYQIPNQISIHSDEKTSVYCIVGMKGCGKSTLLNALKEEGYNIFETYRVLEQMYEAGYLKKETLPHPSLWTSEILEYGIDFLDLRKSKQLIFFGSLVRNEEISFLKSLFNVNLIYRSIPNKIRYSRTLERGRKVESNIDNLVELDCRRTGFWPEYETNDLGSLIAQSEFIFGGIEDDSAITIVKQIKKIIQGNY